MHAPGGRSVAAARPLVAPSPPSVMSTHSTVHALAALLLLAGCPADKAIDDDTNATTAATDTSGDTEPTGGPAPAACPEHAKVDACCCFAAKPDDDPRYVEVVCPAAALCEVVEFECDDLDLLCATTTGPALECALTALSAGTGAGLVEVHYNIGGGYGDTRIKIYMQGDGTAYIVYREALDLSDVHRPTGRFDLKPKAYFDDCLAKPSDDERAKCLMAVSEGEASEQCIGELYAEAL